jgi:hypothetical protein
MRPDLGCRDIPDAMEFPGDIFVLVEFDAGVLRGVHQRSKRAMEGKNHPFTSRWFYRLFAHRAHTLTTLQENIESLSISRPPRGQSVPTNEKREGESVF